MDRRLDKKTWRMFVKIKADPDRLPDDDDDDDDDDDVHYKKDNSAVTL